MRDLWITHRNKYIKDGIAYSDDHRANLLHGEDNFEAMLEYMDKDGFGYLYTIDDVGIEFTYILRGSMELRQGEESIILRAGDSYSHHALPNCVLFHILEDVEILEVSTRPHYDVYEKDQKVLTDVLTQLQAVDGETLDHCNRVKKLSMGIAFYLRYQGNLDHLFFAAYFHDVGKSKIPVEILTKPGRLTDAEYSIMKQHSRYTYEMIRDHYGEELASVAFGHHEKLDGTGYPLGLKGDEISLASRIICVADAYDAMVVTRPYRKALSIDEAMAELRRCVGTQFDARVVAALEELNRDTGMKLG